MNTEKKFPEQEAPAKNTDNAFVQVGEDGEPVVPQTNDENTTTNETVPDPDNV